MGPCVQKAMKGPQEAQQREMACAAWDHNLQSSCLCQGKAGHGTRGGGKVTKRTGPGKNRITYLKVGQHH